MYITSRTATHYGLYLSLAQARPPVLLVQLVRTVTVSRSCLYSMQQDSDVTDLMSAAVRPATHLTGSSNHVSLNTSYAAEISITDEDGVHAVP